MRSFASRKLSPRLLLSVWWSAEDVFDSWWMGRSSGVGTVRTWHWIVQMVLRNSLNIDTLRYCSRYFEKSSARISVDVEIFFIVKTSVDESWWRGKTLRSHCYGADVLYWRSGVFLKFLQAHSVVGLSCWFHGRLLSFMNFRGQLKR